MEGHRKFVFCLFIFLSCYWLLFIGRLPPSSFESIVWGVLVAFSGGNVGEWAFKRKPDV